ETILKQCDAAADISVCLNSAYRTKQSELDQMKATAEDTRKAKEKSLATPGDITRATQLIDQIEGVYKKQFANALVDGTKYTSEDILELVRVSPDTLYFRTHLEFYNGHECELYGLARFSEAGLFVFNDPEGPPLEEYAPCKLQIEVTDKEI